MLNQPGRQRGSSTWTHDGVHDYAGSTLRSGVQLSIILGALVTLVQGGGDGLLRTGCLGLIGRHVTRF